MSMQSLTSQGVVRLKHWSLHMQVLQRLQAAFFAGNISMTDEGSPPLNPHALSPPGALETYLHATPDGNACAPFAASGINSIAIVGNGPLSQAHAAAANRHDLVMRYGVPPSRLQLGCASG